MDLVCQKYIYIYIFISFLKIELVLFIKQCPFKFMCVNTLSSTKVGAKWLSDLVIFSIVSSDIPLIFQRINSKSDIKFSVFF